MLVPATQQLGAGTGMAGRAPGGRHLALSAGWATFRGTLGKSGAHREQRAQGLSRALPWLAPLAAKSLALSIGARRLPPPTQEYGSWA